MTTTTTVRTLCVQVLPTSTYATLPLTSHYFLIILPRRREGRIMLLGNRATVIRQLFLFHVGPSGDIARHVDLVVVEPRPRPRASQESSQKVKLKNLELKALKQ